MKNLKKIVAIATAVIGIIVIVLGITLFSQASNYTVDEDYFTYNAESYDVEYAKFGADFYTSIYEASDVIVSELNDINEAMEIAIEAQDSINTAVSANILATYKVGGAIVIAIGLGIFTYALQCFWLAFSGVSSKNTSAETISSNEAENTVPEA